MIIGDNREAVIKNIEILASEGAFNDKAEINDPVISSERVHEIIDHYLKSRGTCGYKMKNHIARAIASCATKHINKNTEIVGAELLNGLDSGAIITSNHFSPVDNTVVRHLTSKLKKKRLNIVCQITNFAMEGFIGFLMNNADTIPVGPSAEYMSRDLPQILHDLLKKKEFILIYPEKEMWFNYRKPRPLIDGAYHYAAKFNVPIISCFVEMIDLEDMETEHFHKVEYKMHVLGVLYPDSSKTIRENREELLKTDYKLKKEAYEKIYHKNLNYSFETFDIAGWTGEGAESVV